MLGTPVLCCCWQAQTPGGPGAASGKSSTSSTDSTDVNACRPDQSTTVRIKGWEATASSTWYSIHCRGSAARPRRTRSPAPSASKRSRGRRSVSATRNFQLSSTASSPGESRLLSILFRAGPSPHLFLGVEYCLCWRPLVILHLCCTLVIWPFDLNWKIGVLSHNDFRRPSVPAVSIRVQNIAGIVTKLWVALHGINFKEASRQEKHDAGKMNAVPLLSQKLLPKTFFFVKIDIFIVFLSGGYRWSNIKSEDILAKER